MAPDLPAYKNMILVCLLGKCISQSSHELFLAAGLALVTVLGAGKLVSVSDTQINVNKFTVQP